LPQKEKTRRTAFLSKTLKGTGAGESIEGGFAPVRENRNREYQGSISANSGELKKISQGRWILGHRVKGIGRQRISKKKLCVGALRVRQKDG